MAVKGAYYPLEFDQGKTYTEEFFLLDYSTGEKYETVPTDARMKIKTEVEGTLIDELTVANSRLVIDSDANSITINLGAAVTEAYNFISGVYDMEIEFASGVVWPIVYGPCLLNREVTDPDA